MRGWSSEKRAGIDGKLRLLLAPGQSSYYQLWNFFGNFCSLSWIGCHSSSRIGERSFTGNSSPFNEWMRGRWQVHSQRVSVGRINAKMHIIRKWNPDITVKHLITTSNRTLWANSEELKTIVRERGLLDNPHGTLKVSTNALKHLWGGEKHLWFYHNCILGVSAKQACMTGW